MSAKASHSNSAGGMCGRRIPTCSSSSLYRVTSCAATSNTLMCLTMRVLVLMALCLCFAAPSPVLSITLPDGDFAAKTQMVGVGGDATEEEKFNAIAKNLIRTVLNAAEQDEMVNGELIDEEDDEIPLSKRAGSSSRREREPRWSYPLGRRGADQMGSRSNPPILTSRSKFTFGKRSPLVDPRPSAKQLLLEELEKQAYLRNQEDLAFLDDTDLYNTEPEDDHQVQKDAMSAFSFGKRGLSAFSFGKRAMPSFAFGKKRGYSSFAFGKKSGLRGPAFAFGRREWMPAEQGQEQLGPYEIKRNVAFAFGKRENQ